MKTSVTIALIVLLLPHKSIGVCLAMIIGSFVSWPLSMWYAARLTGLGQSVQIRQEAPALGATLIMMAALLLIRRPIEMYLPPWPAVATFGAAGIALYLAALALIGRGELMSLFKLAKNVRVVLGRSPALDQDEETDIVVAGAE